MIAWNPRRILWFAEYISFLLLFSLKHIYHPVPLLQIIVAHQTLKLTIHTISRSSKREEHLAPSSPSTTPSTTAATSSSSSSSSTRTTTTPSAGSSRARSARRTSLCYERKRVSHLTNEKIYYRGFGANWTYRSDGTSARASAAAGGNVAVAAGARGAVCPCAVAGGDVAGVPAVVHAWGEVDGVHEWAVHWTDRYRGSVSEEYTRGQWRKVWGG